MVTFAILFFLLPSLIVPDRVIYCGYAADRIIVDGKLDDWQSDHCLILTGDVEKSENRVKIRSGWDHEYLYLSFEVHDTDIRAYQDSRDSPKLFLDDMVEVLFDPDNSKDSCWNYDNIVYHINALGRIKDDRGRKDCSTDPSWNGDALIAVHIDGTLNDTVDCDRGYVIELAFPWRELGLTPFAGLHVGVNFANGDNDGKGRQLFDWCGAWPMRSPHAFGDLVLLDGPLSEAVIPGDSCRWWSVCISGNSDLIRNLTNNIQAEFIKPLLSAISKFTNYEGIV